MRRTPSSHLCHFACAKWQSYMSADRCPQTHLAVPHASFASCVLCSQPSFSLVTELCFVRGAADHPPPRPPRVLHRRPSPDLSPSVAHWPASVQLSATLGGAHYDDYQWPYESAGCAPHHALERKAKSQPIEHGGNHQNHNPATRRTGDGVQEIRLGQPRVQVVPMKQLDRRRQHFGK